MSHTSIRYPLSNRNNTVVSSQHTEAAIRQTRAQLLNQSQTKSSLIPTSATFVRTRSMTRLSGVLDENKLAPIDRATGKLAKPHEQEKGKPAFGAAARRPLGAKMSAQMGAGGGMKRRLGSPGMPKKRIKVDQNMKKIIVLADKENEQEKANPRTPERAQRALVQVQPTPARDILGAGPTLDEEDEVEVDDSPAIASRFIARPPTPPRPHMDLCPSPVRSQAMELSSTPSPLKRMDLDSPNRHGIADIVVTPTRASVSSTSSIIHAAPQTPRMSTQTPRRVMGSVSRFRAAPPSTSGASVSPVKSSSNGRPVLASILAATDIIPAAAAGQSVNATLHPESGGDGHQVEEEVQSFSTGPDKSDGHAPVSEAVVDSARVVRPVSPEQHPDTAIEVATTSPSIAKFDLVQSQLSFSPAGLPKPTASYSSMPPPSRIPRAASKLSLSISNIAATAADDRPKKSSVPVSTKPSLSSLGRGLPSTASSMSLSATSSGEAASVRRKPSYPSSLGSGPLNRPRDRMVSGPTLYPQRDGTLATSKGELSIPQGRQSPRSVSEPAPRARPRTELSASTSRREGMSTETSKSMAGLSDALNKLKMRRSESQSEPNRPRQSMSATFAAPASRVNPAGPSAFKQPMTSVVASTSRLSSVHRPRQSIVPLTTAPFDTSMAPEEEQAGDRSLAAILLNTTENKCFKGVVAFVDVRTADGEDASPIFVEMLKSLGARVSCVIGTVMDALLMLRSSLGRLRTSRTSCTSRAGLPHSRGTVSKKRRRGRRWSVSAG